MKIRSRQAGFSVVEIVLVLVITGLVGTVGFMVYNKHNKKVATDSTPVAQSQSKKASTGTSSATKTEKLTSYTTDNEGLVFDYDPTASTVKQVSAEKSNDGLYVVKTEVTTGNVKLVITTGVSGIGGGPKCIPDGRATCKVVDNLTSTYLQKPVTYRLIEANTVTECGYAGKPSCDQAPLTTSYFLDTSASTEAFGPCCSTIGSDALNLGHKATVNGSVLVDIEPSDAIANASLLKNSDVLKTIKIIESLHYPTN